MKKAVNRTISAGIPLDVQYGVRNKKVLLNIWSVYIYNFKNFPQDIDHFRRHLDFTYDKESFKGLPEYVDELKSQGIRFITIMVMKSFYRNTSFL